MTDSPTAAELQSRIDAARREYDRLREGLEQQLGRHFNDGGDVADRLLSAADEFGRDRALELMAERPDDYGVRHSTAEREWRESAAEYSAGLERLVEVHDRLDELTRAQEKLDVRDPANPGRVVNIQGRAYDFDTARGELREIETDARYPVQLDREEPRLTAVQRALRDTNAAKAEPQPDRDRTRGR